MVRGARYAVTVSRPGITTASDSHGLDVPPSPTVSEVRAPVDILSAREVERAAARGIRATAAARFPHGTAIDAASTVTVAGTVPTPPDEIAGAWEVAAVEPSRLHLRALLRRST